MKKHIVFFLFTVFCLNMIMATAEERFSLRCGVFFGDSKEVIKSKETLIIAAESDYEITTNSGKLAGIDVDAVVYRFDENNGLISVLWTIVDAANEDYAITIYNTLSDSLSKKYGKPDNTDKNTHYLIKGAAIEEMYALMEEEFLFPILVSFGEAGPMYQSEWHIESYKNENVKIDLLLYKHDENDYRLRLSYDLFTDEQLKKLQDEQKENEKRVSDDI